MDGPRSCDVYDAHLVEEARLAPDPAGGDAVDDGVKEGKDAVRLEVAPREQEVSEGPKGGEGLFGGGGGRDAGRPSLERFPFDVEAEGRGGGRGVIGRGVGEEALRHTETNCSHYFATFGASPCVAEERTSITLVQSSTNIFPMILGGVARGVARQLSLI